jgi:hypothetical protein
MQDPYKDERGPTMAEAEGAKNRKWTVVLNQEQVEFIENALGNYSPACFEPEDTSECALLQNMFNNLLVDPTIDEDTINDFTL